MENKVIPFKFTLKNGLRVIFIPMLGIKSVTVSIEGIAGAYSENKDETGLAHFTEHMLFNGTQKFPTQEELEDYISCLGGVSNARTSYPNIAYFTRLHKDHFEDACNYISQIIIHPSFTNESVAKEKRVIGEEIKDHQNDKYYKFGKREKEFLYQGQQRLHQDISGDIVDIEQITLESLTDFYNRNYTAQNFVLGIVGDLDSHYVQNLVEKYFSGMPSGQLNTLPMILLNNTDKTLVYTEDTFSQADVCSYFPGYKYTNLDKRIPAKVLASVLGGGLYSRLTSVIREKYGLVYGISAVHTAYDDFGFFKVSFSTDEKNIDKVLELQAIEISKIKNELISNKEYMREMNLAVNSHAFIYEEPIELLNVYLLLEIHGLHDHSIEDLLAKIKSTTPEMIRDIANEIFVERPKVSIATKNNIKLK